MRAALALLAMLALAAGCGGSGEGGGNEVTEPARAADMCLGERGFSLRPSSSGVAAVSPSGVELTIAFFDTEAEATAAADRAEGSSAVGNAVVTPSDGRLTGAELETIEECVRGGG